MSTGAAETGLSLTPLVMRHKELEIGRGLRVHHGDPRPAHAEREPPPQHGTAHLSGAGEQDRIGARSGLDPSRLALGFEHRAVKRFPGGLAGPEDELEGLKIAVAGRDRHLENGLALAPVRIRAPLP